MSQLTPPLLQEFPDLTLLSKLISDIDILYPKSVDLLFNMHYHDDRNRAVFSDIYRLLRHNRSGYGVFYGILNPVLARPGVCNSGETPLECEYRIVKPAVALEGTPPTVTMMS